MGFMTALMVLFAWLKLGSILEISWWWILLPVGVTIVEGFISAIFD
jgi:hypothetical protein